MADDGYRIVVNVEPLKRMLMQLDQRMQAASPMGVRKVMQQIKRDSIGIVPTAPKKTGEMRRQHIVLPVEKKAGTLIGKMQVRTRYAASLHTGRSRWGTMYKFKTPGSGAKWIEKKLRKLKKKYVKIIRDELPIKHS